jgi:serine/threonine protein phosphatase PrpC
LGGISKISSCESRWIQSVFKKLISDNNIQIISSATHISAAQAQSTRETQEDLTLNFDINIPQINNGKGTILGIADGHSINGSKQTTEAIDANIRTIFAESLLKRNGSTELAIKDTYSRLHGLTKGIDDGSTLSIAYIYFSEDDQQLKASIGILGDSPILAFSPNYIAPEHNLFNNPTETDHLRNEKKILLRRGQFSIHDGYIDVNGRWLAVSRCLGDAWAGNAIDRTPEITSLSLNENSRLIIASDGIYGLADANQKKSVINFINSNSYKPNSAELIVKDAIDRKTDDNVSVVSWKGLPSTEN